MTLEDRHGFSPALPCYGKDSPAAPTYSTPQLARYSLLAVDPNLEEGSLRGLRGQIHGHVPHPR